MFEKRKLTSIAERVLEILPQNGPSFDMRRFPGIPEQELPDCENIFVMAEHLSSAVCAAYCSRSVYRVYGHTPQILLIGKNDTYSREILMSLGIDEKTVHSAETVKEFYCCDNLGKNILVLLPLHASFKIKQDALQWNFGLIGTSHFISIREEFCEINKTENFFSDLYETVKIVEYNLGKRRFLPIDEKADAYRDEYFGVITEHKSSALILTEIYKSKYGLQKKGLCSSPKKISKQKNRLIEKFASCF